MLWFPHKKYTAEYYATQLAAICRHTRISTRYMVIVAGVAVLTMTAANLGIIYGL